LRDIVASADLGALCLVPGVGKKTAERLVIELKNRLGSLDHSSVVPTRAGGTSSAIGDVREALAQLGYGAEEIRDTLRDLPTDSDASTMLRDALKLLGARRAR
jgi:Holliday junction DNA helicase RuvA